MPDFFLRFFAGHCESAREDEGFAGEFAVLGRFVGNDGNCGMLAIAGERPDQKERRKNLSESLYTSLESLIIFNHNKALPRDSRGVRPSECLLRPFPHASFLTTCLPYA